MSSKIPVLFVAFEFPPLGGAGVQRSLKFVKYLPLFDIQPIVLTIQSDDYKLVMPGHPMDPGLLKDLPGDTIIERVHCDAYPPGASRLVNWARIYFSVTGDFKDLWEKDLVKALPGIIEKYKPQAVYLTLPPFIMARLWMRLLKPYRIPLLVDFRDAWSQWCIAMNATRIHYSLKRMYENSILQRASVVVCSSKQIAADLKRVHPHIPASKLQVIHNGYDAALPEPSSWAIQPKKMFVIGYVGSFYYTPEARTDMFTPWWKKALHRMPNYVPRKEDWLYRSPWFFFRSVALLLKKHPEYRAKLQIQFAGKIPHWLEAQVQEFGLTDLVTYKGYLAHHDVIQFQHSCDALLLTSSKVIGGRDYSIAGKTFEYFSMGKPVLAFVTEGAQKDILNETGVSILCDPDDAEESAGTLKNMLDGKIQVVPNIQAIQQYHRKVATETLADLLKTMTQPSSTIRT